MENFGQYLTVQDASKRLGVSVSTLRNWDKSGKLKSQRNPYNDYRIYRQEDIEAVLQTLHAGKSAKPTVRLPKKDIGEFTGKVIQGDCLEVSFSLSILDTRQFVQQVCLTEDSMRICVKSPQNFKSMI